MELTLEVEGFQTARVVQCVGEPHESVHVIIRRALIVSDLADHELVEVIEQDDIVVAENVLARELPHHRVKVHLTCVVVHFEGQHAEHFFASRARWSRVHHWACDKFEVAKDACPNLELYEGSPKGPALNEKLPVGKSKDCLAVWLVKPGPEPYGRSA